MTVFFSPSITHISGKGVKYANTERRLALPRRVSHGNTIITLKFFCTKLQKVDEIVHF